MFLSYLIGSLDFKVTFDSYWLCFISESKSVLDAIIYYFFRVKGTDDRFYLILFSL